MKNLISAILMLAIDVSVPAPPALGDEIRLKWGGRIEGIVRSIEGTSVTIETDIGSVGVNREDVLEIVYGPCALSILHEREVALGDSRDATSILDLACWARSRGLACHARALFDRVVEIEPANEKARTALGYRLHQGQWLTWTGFMRATGHVEFRGRWVTLDAREATLAREASVKKAQAEARTRREEARRKSYEREARSSQRVYGYAGYGGYPDGWGLRHFRPWFRGPVVGGRFDASVGPWWYGGRSGNAGSTGVKRK